jgi:hypothetical protein
MTYLITCNGKGRIVDVPSEASSDDYGRLQRAFANEVARHGEDHYPAMWRLYPCYSRDGVYWHEELAGPDGASFVVFQFPEHMPEQVNAVVEYLQQSRDVVRLKVLRLKWHRHYIGRYARSIESGWLGRVVACEWRGDEWLLRMQGVNEMCQIVAGGDTNDWIDEDDTQWFTVDDLAFLKERK